MDVKRDRGKKNANRESEKEREKHAKELLHNQKRREKMVGII